MIRSAIAAALLAAVSAPALAGPDAFGPGPLIPEFGRIASVEGAAPIPGDAEFRVSFDTAAAAPEDGLNRTLESAARFLNMHAAAGVPAEAMQLAVVIHGGALTDVTREGAGANAALVEALLAHNVEIHVCGQSAAWYDVAAADLLPGVTMALSAMTVHAQLQAEGYSLNPF